MLQYPEFSASLTPPLDRLDFTLQRALIRVAANVMIYFHDRRQRTLAKTRHGAYRELLVGRRLQDLVSTPAVAFIFERQAEFQAQAREEIARAARVARRAAADADSVVALWLEVEQGIEGGNAIDPGKRRLRFHRNVLQRLHGKILVRVVLLNGFQDTQQCAGALILADDNLINESAFPRVETFLGHFVHSAPFAGTGAPS